MIKTTVKDFVNMVYNGEEIIVSVLLDKKTVLRCETAEINTNQVESKGYTIENIPAVGGAIIAQAGDVCFGMTTYATSGIDFNDIVLTVIKDKLIEKGLNAAIVKNDILVDGYKVAGIAQTMVKHLLCVAASISISVNLTDIESISEKRTEKIPKGLSEYGITSQYILDSLAYVEQAVINAEQANRFYRTSIK